MAVVKEKAVGTIEQLMVSPITAFELVVGKLIPFALVGLIDAALVGMLALTIFHVPLRGNALLLLLATIPYLLCRLVHLGAFKHAAGGGDVHLFYRLAVCAAFGFCVSDPEHAEDGSVGYGFKSAALLPGDRTRRFSQRRWDRRALAAYSYADDTGYGDDLYQLPALFRKSMG